MFRCYSLLYDHFTNRDEGERSEEKSSRDWTLKEGGRKCIFVFRFEFSLLLVNIP